MIVGMIVYGTYGIEVASLLFIKLLTNQTTLKYTTYK